MTDLLTRTIGAITPLDADAMRAAEARQMELTKPPKALGRLETLSIQLAGIQGKAQPVIETKAIAVMAADHGVTAEGVSAFPAEVTPGMVFNFAAGGAAINVIGRHVGARVLVTDVGVNADLSAAEGVRQKKVRMGTANMAQGPAMTREQAVRAIEIGIELVEDKASRDPAFQKASAVVDACLERGLMVGRTGPVFGDNGNTIKLKPAVNSSEEELMEMLDRFEAALAEVEVAS